MGDEFFSEVGADSRLPDSGLGLSVDDAKARSCGIVNSYMVQRFSEQLVGFEAPGEWTGRAAAVPRLASHLSRVKACVDA
jgi:hypothetical protein